MSEVVIKLVIIIDTYRWVVVSRFDSNGRGDSLTTFGISGASRFNVLN